MKSIFEDFDSIDLNLIGCDSIIHDEKMTSKGIKEIEEALLFCFGDNMNKLNPAIAPKEYYSKEYMSNYKEFFNKEDIPDDWDKKGIVDKINLLKESKRIKELNYTLEREDKKEGIFSSLKNKKQQEKLDEEIVKYIDGNKKLLKIYDDMQLFLITYKSSIKDNLENNYYSPEFEKLNDQCTLYFKLLDNAISNLNSINEKFIADRDLHYDDEIQYDNQLMISMLLNQAQMLLKERYEPTCERYKDKKNLQYDSAICYRNLKKADAKIDSIYDILLELTNNTLSKDSEEYIKTKNFFTNQKQHYQDNKDYVEQSIRMYLNKKQKTVENFFSEFLLTNEERLVQIQALKLATIETMDDLQDFLINNKNEIKIEKTDEGKLEISFVKLMDLSSEYNITNHTESSKDLLASQNTITYIYDPVKRNLEGYKVSNKTHLFGSEYDSQINENINNEISLFLGNLESSFDINIHTLFNKNIYTLKDTSINANALKIKDKLKEEYVGGSKITKGLLKLFKIEKDPEFDFEIDGEITAGNLSINKLSIKPQIFNAKIKGTIETEKYKIQTPSISSGIEKIDNAKSLLDNITTSIKGQYYNFSMRGWLKDINETIGISGETFLEMQSNGVLKINEKTMRDIESIDWKYKEQLFENIENIKNSTELLRSVLFNNPESIENILNNTKTLDKDFKNYSFFKKIIVLSKVYKDNFKELKDSTKDLKETFDKLKKDIYDKNSLKDKFLKSIEKEKKDVTMLTKTNFKSISNIKEKILNTMTDDLSNASVKKELKGLIDTYIKNISQENAQGNKNFLSAFKTIMHETTLNKSQEEKDFILQLYNKLEENIVTIADKKIETTQSASNLSDEILDFKEGILMNIDLYVRANDDKQMDALKILHQQLKEVFDDNTKDLKTYQKESLDIVVNYILNDEKTSEAHKMIFTDVFNRIYPNNTYEKKYNELMEYKTTCKKILEAFEQCSVNEIKDKLNLFFTNIPNAELYKETIQLAPAHLKEIVNDVYNNNINTMDHHIKATNTKNNIDEIRMDIKKASYKTNILYNKDNFYLNNLNDNIETLFNCNMSPNEINEQIIQIINGEIPFKNNYSIFPDKVLTTLQIKAFLYDAEEFKSKIKTDVLDSDIDMMKQTISNITEFYKLAQKLDTGENKQMHHFQCEIENILKEKSVENKDKDMVL